LLAGASVRVAKGVPAFEVTNALTTRRAAREVGLSKFLAQLALV
jgi:hypothetical protein